MSDSYKIYASQEYVDSKIDDKVTSWNDLQDRPFGEEQTVIEWDGVIGDRAFTEIAGMYFAKVSDLTPQLNDMASASGVVHMSRGEGAETNEPIGFNVEGAQTVTGENAWGCEDTMGSLSVLCAVAAGGSVVVSGATITLPEKGLYFLMLDLGNGMGMHVSRLENTTLTQLDPKFIPSSVALDEELHAIAKSGSWNDLVDKPFYEAVNETVILEETTITVEGGTNDSFGGEIGKAVTSPDYNTVLDCVFIWDGTEYTGKIRDSTNNSVILNVDDPPFTYYAVGANRPVFYCDTDGDHTLKIVQRTASLVTLDEKFIPSSVPVIQSATVGQTIVVKTVDATGKPTEWKAVDIERPSMTQVTLTTANWDDSTKSQTITVTGILADTTAQNIQVNPIPTNMHYAVESGLYCSAQAANSLTFSCSVVPIEDITLNVVWQDVNYIS